MREVRSREAISSNSRLCDRRARARARRRRRRAQICRLLRGFTHPDTYFQATEDGFYYLEAGVALPENSIHEFSEDIEALLVVVLRTRLVEKLTNVLHGARAVRQQQPC